MRGPRFSISFFVVVVFFFSAFSPNSAAPTTSTSPTSAAEDHARAHKHTHRTYDNVDYLNKVTALDDVARVALSQITSEATAHLSVQHVRTVTAHYAHQRYYNRALKLLSVTKDVLPDTFYDAKLAEIEATMHYCVEDVNHALKILHEARDNLLKYLGGLDKKELQNHFDVLEIVHSMTGKLVSWYRQAGAVEGADALAAWMVETSSYRNGNQLPQKFVRELTPLGPFPELGNFHGHFEELSFLIDTIQDFNLGGQGFTSCENDSFDKFGHDIDCLVEKKNNISSHYFKELTSKDDNDLHELGARLNGRDGGKLDVIKLALHKLSASGVVRGHFGASNTILSVLHQVAGTKGLNCVTVIGGGMESRFNASFILFDDSYLTSFRNNCDEEAIFIRVDFNHPHYREE